MKFAFKITLTKPDILWNVNVQIATVCPCIYFSAAQNTQTQKTIFLLTKKSWMIYQRHQYKIDAISIGVKSLRLMNLYGRILKFIHCEKATTFEKSSICVWHYLAPTKLSRICFQFFVAFSEYLNFKSLKFAAWNPLWHKLYRIIRAKAEIFVSFWDYMNFKSPRQTHFWVAWGTWQV